MFPNGSSSTDSLARNLNQTVDVIADVVESEINQIANDAELFAQDISSAYQMPDSNQGLNRSRPRAAPAPQSRANGGAKGKGGSPVAVADVDEVEEITLSHEVLQDESHVAKQLDTSFLALRKQIEEYQRLYSEANQRLKDVEAQRNELETKLEDSTDDNAKLMQELRQLQSSQGLANRAFQSLPPGGAKPNEELQKRAEELRKALLYANDDEGVAITLDDIWKAKDIRKQLFEWLNNHMPFKKDISKIQSRFGSSVASYFVFYRFVFLHLVLCAGFVCLFLVLHLFSYATFQSAAWQSFFSSPGYLPYCMLFSSYHTSEGLNYDLCVLCILLLTSIVATGQLVTEDKQAKNLEALESQERVSYSKEVLCCWDHSLRTSIDRDDLCANIGNQLLQLLEATRTTGLRTARSRYQTFILYCQRTLGLALYLSVLAASCAVILYVTLYSDWIAHQADAWPGLRNIQSFVSPMILTVISTVMPEIAKKVTALEAWDSAQTVTTVNLLRVYISSLLNTLLLISSYLVLADPFLLASDSSLRNSFGLIENDSYACRMDQVADGLFTLVLVTWGIQGVMLVAVPIGMRTVHKMIGRPYKKSEFQVADNMVKRLNLVGLVYATIPFSPLAVVFYPPLFALGFKWEKYVVREYYAKPTRPFSGQKAGLMYAFFYFCTFLAIALPTAAYFLTTKTFAKSCSIQDDHVGLCAGALNGNNTCVQSTVSEYYAFYRTTNYPKDLCERSCGAFVNEASHFSPFHYRVDEMFIVRYLWQASFDYPYIPWLGFFLLVLWIARARNSLDVLRWTWYHKERSMAAQLQANEAERKRQEKMIRKLKTIAHTEDDLEDDEGKRDSKQDGKKAAGLHEE